MTTSKPKPNAKVEVSASRNHRSLYFKKADEVVVDGKRFFVYAVGFGENCAEVRVELRPA